MPFFYCITKWHFLKVILLYLWHIKPYRLQEILSREHNEWLRQFYTGAIESENLFAYYEEQRNLLESQVFAYISEDPFFIQNGIFNLDDFWNYSLEIDDMWYRLFTPSSEFLGRRFDHINTFRTNLEWFDDQELVRGFSQSNLERVEQLELTERQYARITEVLENDEWQSSLHGEVFWEFTNLVRQISFLLIIASLVLHSTLVTNDRMRNILPLQYHTKIGRKIGTRQFAATIISALMLATIVMSAFAIALASYGTFAYWNEGITSYLTVWGFNSLSVGFTPITFGNYMLIMALLCYALCIGTAAIAFAISRFSRNFISLTVKSVPVFAALSFMHSWVLPNRWATSFIDRFSAPLTLFNHLYLRTGIAYLDAILIIAFATIFLFLSFVVAWRERKLELL